jgi:hypothetical protein
LGTRWRSIFIGNQWFLNLYANHTKGKWQFNTSIDANYGLMTTESWGAIKNDDKLELLNKWNYPVFKPNKKEKIVIDWA